MDTDSNGGDPSSAGMILKWRWKKEGEERGCDTDTTSRTMSTNDKPIFEIYHLRIVTKEHIFFRNLLSCTSHNHMSRLIIKKINFLVACEKQDHYPCKKINILHVVASGH